MVQDQAASCGEGCQELQARACRRVCGKRKAGPARRNMTDIPIQNRTALDRFEVLRTTSVETLRRSLARKYTKPRLEPLGDRNEFQAQINTCKLTNITLSYARFSAQRMILLTHTHSCRPFC